jgi:hypothetical protein
MQAAVHVESGTVPQKNASRGLQVRQVDKPAARARHEMLNNLVPAHVSTR